MKKRISCFVVFCLLLSIITSCGNSQNTTDALSKENEELKAKLETAVSKAEYDALVAENEELKNSIAEKETETALETETIVSSQEPIHVNMDNLTPVLYEDEKMKLSINSFGYANGETVFKIFLTLENNDSEELYTALSDVEIDNFQIDSTCDFEGVAPGKSGVTEVAVWQDEIDKTGKTDWTSFNANVIIRNGFWSDAIVSVPVVVDKECWDSVE